MIIEISIIILYLMILVIAICCHFQVCRCVHDLERLFEHNARITKVLAEHEEKFAALEVNEPKVIDEDEKKEQKADNDYNEGMNNIFGYSVTTGIKVGDE